MNKKQIDLAARAAAWLSENPDCLGKILDSLGTSMPNITTKTMGGKVFWNDLAECKGWRIQKNTMLGNCRILNPSNERMAWGGEEAMFSAFESILGKEN